MCTIFFWSELQDHIDFQTRYVAISLQVWSENTALQAYAKLVFEFPLSGGISPSPLIFSARTDGTTNSDVETYLHLSLVIFILFLPFEFLSPLEEGMDYFRSVWSYLDLINFILFLIMYTKLSSYYFSDEDHEINADSSLITKTMDFHERYQYFEEFEGAIQLLAMNTLLLCFKAIKNFNGPGAQMQELIDVMNFCLPKLMSLTAVIMLTVVGFAVMFWVLLGSTMSGFSVKTRSIITMIRASLGDFDVAAIDENSPSEGSSVHH